uniref:Protein YAE1 n=1 Tax=Bionectria ochroleuca TaxID=29856 RepID=A0A8H7NJW2_BIOOC
MHFQPIENLGDDGYVSGGGGAFIATSNVNDTLDDIFGGDDLQPAEDYHPSDMRRLETEHTTAGYREGIALGKEATLQQGFDEGYSVGAALGLQAGQLLGLLEGIAEAAKANADNPTAEIETLLNEGRTELSVEKIFSSDHWKPNGERNYTISPSDSTAHQVAQAHPVIRKWIGIVDEQVRVWGVDKSLLDHLNPEPAQQTHEELPAHGDEPARDLLDW